MVWIRYAKILAIWRCYTTKGYSTKYHNVGVSIKDEYEKRPTEDIEIWAKRLGDFVVDKMCKNSCESLSTSVFCDKTSLQVDVIYTSETLVAGAKEKEKKEVEKEAIAIPKHILGQIDILEDKYKEAVSIDEKIAIMDEINRLKQRYGIEMIPSPEAKPIEVKPVEAKFKAPKYILEQIDILEERYKEVVTIDEKLAIRDEINKLKERYNII